MAEFRTQNVPIFKLPDDVLEFVFLVNNSEYRNARKISQVCVLWRIIALSIPKLWNLIELNPRKGVSQWQNELLRRSANSPYIAISFVYHRSFDDFLTAHPKFIPRICLLSTSGTISDWAWNKLVTSGTQLQEIHLSFNEYINNYRKTILPNSNGSPVQVFKQAGGTVGRLCSPSPFLANLVHLSLSYTTCTILQFAFMVEHMALLERLHFLGDPSVFLPRGIQPPPISIPLLRYLHTDIPHFIDHVILPPECALSFTCSSSKPYTADMVMTVADRFIVDHTRNGISYLTIVAEPSPGRLVIGNQRSSYNRAEFVPPPEIHDQLKLWGVTQNCAAQWFPIAVLMITRLSSILPTVVSLSLILDNENQFRQFEPYLRHFNGVKSLHFGLYHSFADFAPLQITYDVDINESGGGILFPSLETLYTHKNFDPEDGDQLESYLQWRIEHGKPIKYIKCRYDTDRYVDGRWHESVGLGTQYAESIRNLETKYGLQGDILPLIKGGRA